MNAPSNDRKMNSLLTVSYLGNGFYFSFFFFYFDWKKKKIPVVEGEIVKYVNLDMESITKLTVKQLQDNQPVKKKNFFYTFFFYTLF